MLRKITVLLSALAMLGVMFVPPAMAVDPGGNHGHKSADGPDKNLGGGQEKVDHVHPPKAGGDKHAGGDQHGGGIV
jgi:hypothetical protein